MRSEFTFDQALFGYDNGHHLLGASLQLPSEVRHILAVATDLSGSAPADGFDAAYTGMPLTGTNYYAFFCTWLAPEMPRPGCVWSHVVLIELADFADLLDLGTLRRICRRPVSQNLNQYQTKLTFRFQGESALIPSKSLMHDAEEILSALYLKPRESIVLPRSDAQETEDLIFALWSQQWPRLRRSFRFSTGSFADRGRGATPFDLQVSPKANRRAWQRKGEYLLIDNSVAAIEGLQARPANTQSWMSAALDDLFAPGVSEFRSFLRNYGADVNDPRGAFSRLGNAYERIVLHPSSDWLETLRSVGEIFCDPAEAVQLKQWLVNSPLDVEPNLATASFLLAATESEPYAGISLDFSQIAQKLWRTAPKGVLSLLAQVVRQQERPSTTAFAGAVASSIQPADLGMISEERPDLIPFFLGLRPAFASQVETWRLPTHIQWRIYEVLDSLVLDAKEWGDIVAAMFIAATNVAVRDAVAKAGPYAIEGAMRWLDHSIAQEYLPSQLWREALSESALDRLEADELASPAALALCSWFVSPESARRVLDACRQDVQRLATQPLEALPTPLRLHVAFLLVTLGLRDADVEGVKLLARGFFPVYDALASGNYSSESWLLLSPELPRLGMWSEWDRCEKLRRGVQKRLSRHKKAMADALLKAATTQGHLKLVHQIYKDLTI